MRYNCYHKHTHYSNIITPDSIVKPIDYAKRAIELGHTSLCTTEHGYAGNIFEYYDIAKEYNLKFVFGIEYYYVNDRFEKDKSNSHLMILAKNKNGMKQMLKIMSEANKTGFYYKPRIDKQLLFSLDPRDVVVTSTCVISYINKHDDYEENFVKPIVDYFGGNFYLEIHDNTHPMQVEYNKKILELHKKYHIPFIHATDSHYIYPEQDKDRTEFLNGKNIYYPEEEGFILDYPDSDAIFERYEKQGVFTKEQVKSALKNTWIIDDFEDIHMDKEVKMPSIYSSLSIEEKHKKLRNILNEQWKKEREEVPKKLHKKYIDETKFELDIIEKTSEVSTVDYFLLNYEIIKRGKEKGGILTRTGRGSAPSFYINKLLGFTEIDRIGSPIPLYPTRFMSVSRILESRSLPDIDFNTADPAPFIEASKEILGEDNVYYMTAFGTMQASEAFRNYCRAINLKMDEYNEIGKNLDYYKNDSKWGSIIKESEKFIGVIDSVSPHPCAFLLLDKPISEEVGVIRVGNDKNVTYCAVIDSGTSDKWKFLKNDLLTVTVWDIIDKTFKLIGKPIPNIRQLDKLLDEKVWKLYEDGITATLNQVGQEATSNMVTKYKPQSVSELSAFVAAIRPGFASMLQTFLNRESFSYGIPEFDELLKSSDNFCLYQENAMATLIYAGFPEDETYDILKQIAKKKGDMQKIKDRFITGFVAKTGSEKNAYKVYQILEDSVRYSFNSSHSLSVAYDSLYGAFLKANYPLEYFTTVLNIYEGNTDMTAKIHHELPYFGIKILPIKFRMSQAHYTPDKQSNSIYKGLASIKYLNVQVAEELYTLKDNPYIDFVEVMVDIEHNTSCNARQMEILIKLNFFEEFGKNRTLHLIYEKFKERYKKTHKEKTRLERIAEIREFVSSLSDESLPPQDQVFFEKDVLGYVESKYPMLDDAYALILDIDKKYTPKLTVYKFKDGTEKVFKISKKEFIKDGEEQLIIGDVIKVLKTDMKPRKKLVDGKWIDLEETEEWLAGVSVVKRKNNI